MAKFDFMIASQRKTIEKARKEDEARQTAEPAKCGYFNSEIVKDSAITFH